MATPNKIHLPCYIQGFREIVKFLAVLGTLLSFASRDVDQKIEIMEEHFNSPYSSQYMFLGDMIRQEVSSVNLVVMVTVLYPDQSLPGLQRLAY